jgi:ABC-type nitrate/sulfonate/bicarbonate transport system substrate-binding protein
MTGTKRNMHDMRPLLGIACIAIMVVATACSSSSSSSGSPTAGTSGSSGSGGNSQPLAGMKFRMVIDSTATASKVVEEHAVALLKQQGVQTSIKFDAASPQVAIAQLQRGDIDAYAEAVTGGLAAIDAGVKLTDFALAQPRQDYVFIAKKSMSSLADLKGASIGISSITGVNSAQALIVAQQAGLSKGDVKLVVDGGQTTRAASLLAGRVDATMLGHQFAAKAEAQGFHVLFDFTKQESNLYDDNVFATPSWLSSHKTLAVAYNKALLDSFVWFNDPANADAVVTEALQVEPDADKGDTTALFQLLRQADAYPVGSILDPASLDQQQTLYKDSGALEKTVPVSQWVDDTYAKQAKAGS